MGNYDSTSLLKSIKNTVVGGIIASHQNVAHDVQTFDRLTLSSLNNHLICQEEVKCQEDISSPPTHSTCSNG